MKVALQLYTVRDDYSNAEEFKQTLRKVKEMGYDGVEFAGFSGCSASEIKESLKEIGLTAVSSHHNIYELDEHKEDIFAYALELGCNKIVCSYSETDNLDQVNHTMEVLKDCVETAKQYGISVGYHNHSHEFVKLSEGICPMEEIEKCCGLEVDTYWVFNAKLNPAEYLKQKADNVLLVHIKDGDLQGNPCALGEGNNDIKGIMEAAKEIGMEWIIVENDNPKPNGISDIKRSIDFIKSL